MLKTFLGLSASILTTIYGSLFTPDGISFLLFLAIGPACLALLVLPLVNHVPHLEENETNHGKTWFTTGMQETVHGTEHPLAPSPSRAKKILAENMNTTSHYIRLDLVRVTWASIAPHSRLKDGVLACFSRSTQRDLKLHGLIGCKSY